MEKSVLKYLERCLGRKGDGMKMSRNHHWRGLVGWVALFMVLCCGTAWALFDGIQWPEASGEAVNTADRLTIDYSHADLGYVMVHGPSTSQGLKLQVTKDGGGLNYDINGNGDWEVIPLQFGEGNYNFGLFLHASGTKYTSGGQMSVSVKFEDPNSVYRIPNQYVYYVQETPAVAKSDEICEGLTTDQEKFEAVRAYIKENYAYDFDKVNKVTTGLLPSVDYAWEHGMGICQDLAALAACMLRVQGVPTRLDIGYVNGNYYHAWNTVILDGQMVQYDPTADVSSIPLDSAYTLQRWY